MTSAYTWAIRGSRWIGAVLLPCTTSAGLLALVAVAVMPAFGSSRASSVSITVTEGKPTEYSFTLSRKTVAQGTVVFEITNRGTVSHDFAIAGKKTRLLA